VACGQRFETYKAALDARPCHDGLVSRCSYCPRCRGYHVVSLRPPTDFVDGHDYHRGKRAEHEIVDEELGAA
jgi:hypothetical protein